MREVSKETKVMFGLIAIAIISNLLCASEVLAWSVPVAGSFGYDIYDIGVNKMLKGPIGMTAGAGCFLTAAVCCVRQMLIPAGLCGLASGVLFNVDTLTKSLGCMVS